MPIINIQLPDDKVLRLNRLPSGEVEIELEGVGYPNKTHGKPSDYTGIIPTNRLELIANFLLSNAH